MSLEIALLLDAVILGVLQGFLEWLPVSSSAAVILTASNVLGMEPGLAFSYSMFLHISTFAAPLLVFWRFVSWKWRELLPLLAAATAASLLVGAPLFVFLEKALYNVGEGLLNAVVGIMLLITSVILKRQGKVASGHCVDEVSLGVRKYVIVGLVQGLAVIPGLSRSALTIASLSLLGACPAAAVRASYLMSVPVTAAAGLGALIFRVGGAEPVAPVLAAVAVFSGLAAGVASIKLMMRLAGWIGPRLYLLVLLIGLVSLSWGVFLVFIGT